MFTNIRHRFGHQAGLDECSGRISATFLDGIASRVCLMFRKIDINTNSLQILTFVYQPGHFPRTDVVSHSTKSGCGRLGALIRLHFSNDDDININMNTVININVDVQIIINSNIDVDVACCLLPIAYSLSPIAYCLVPMAPLGSHRMQCNKGN